MSLTLVRRRDLLGFALSAAAQQSWRMIGGAELFSELNCDLPGLARAAAAWRAGQGGEARQLLLAYFRRPRSVAYDPWPLSPTAADILAADKLIDQYLFDLGFGYPPQRYPPPIDWSANPTGDIEWAAAMHRFVWQDALLAAYQETGQERYAAGWIRLADDWFRQHSEVDPGRFEWLDIQTGIRASRLLNAFECFRHAASFDGAFLIRFLSAIHAHAQKSFLFPRRGAHNKAVIEADGLFRIGVLFPEFRQASAWRARAMKVLEESLEAQVTAEGVQREWAPTYHNVVATLVVDLLWLARLNRLPVGGRLKAQARRMMDFSAAMTAPDWSIPMIGDTFRYPPAERTPARPWRPLLRAAELFDEPDWKACAEGTRGLIRLGSRCFPDSGMYFLRSGWHRESVFMAIHCSPPGSTVHDQPDNGTFELYAGGRWIMPDSGVYAYPDTPHAAERDWFRQTAVHQTLTLDRRNSANQPSHLLWRAAKDFDCVVFENTSYPGLVHRRTVFRLEDRAFLLLDEAIGTVEGRVEVHFQFAPGRLLVDSAARRAWTVEPGETNVLLLMPDDAEVDFILQEGQISHVLNHKQDRPALSCLHQRPAPAVFLSALVLFDASPPEARVAFRAPFQAGQPRAELELAAGGRRWRAARDLVSGRTSVEQIS
ncbi:MAG: alginate lyase family protein [Acidobacteriota bacterium]